MKAAHPVKFPELGNPGIKVNPSKRKSSVQILANSFEHERKDREFLTDVQGGYRFGWAGENFKKCVMTTYTWANQDFL